MDFSVGKFAELVSAAARNALEVARFGGLDTGEAPSPYDVVHERPIYRLRHYFPDTASSPRRPVLLLVPPMMLAADVFDVSPSSSGVAVLHDHGIDPWVIDFGAPEREEGGLERTLTDHLLALSDAIDEVRSRVGVDIHIGGYSQGGMFCYQTAAYRRSEGIASVITFGSPVDTKAMLPFGIQDETLMRLAGFAADRVLARTNLPAWASRTGFRLLDPVKSVRQRVDFLRQLHDRDALLPRERQRRFLQQEGWVAWPGPALAELVSQIVAGNRMLSGGMVIEGRTVTLADISCPMLCFVGDVDEIAAPAVVRAVRRAAPLAEIHEVGLHAGHFGLVVGSTATESSWPITAAWLRWREGQGDQPPEIQPLPEVVDDPDDPGFVEGVLEGVTVAATLGVETGRILARSAGRGAADLRDLAAEAAQQLPRLARLEGVRPSSRVSLGRLLAERADGSPEDTVFLFEGRGVTYADANRRIDNVVRGLVSVGVRQGEQVGVLMATRPSAITVVAALNRIGAVAVLLRPGGEVALEVGLGGVNRVVTDPEHAPLLRAGALDVQLFVLGGGGAPRDLVADLGLQAGDVVDMERIDPERVTLPAWYRPNPGRARDLAFIVFTGAGERTQVKRITNGRWALSAYGTATAASLSPADTVYGLTPVHHPAGLLTALGGAVAGGARLAMATHFDPATFWEEVRRYGVTVVSYTWTQVHDLVNADRHPLERGHTVRLFLGSGMPVGLWRRVLERFAPAGVLEFYGSTEGEAVLVNLRGTKVGCKGRPLPGSNEVRIAAYDPVAERLVLGPDGFARRCGRGEVGMLLVTAEREAVGTATVLRSVFARDDSWLETGDLFRRDGEGDYWFVGDGTAPVEDAVYDIAAVDLCVAYRVGEHLVAAVTLCPGAALHEAALTGQSADVVRVVDAIPTTAWFRLQSADLRAEGIPTSTAANPVFVLTGDGTYKKLTAARRKALLHAS
jgi:putative long chain acyl-CoA synthase